MGRATKAPPLKHATRGRTGCSWRTRFLDGVPHAMIAPMKRPDLWDYFGLAVSALLVALWVAHMVLPPAPPDPQHDAPAGRTMLGPSLPSIAPGR